MKVHVVIPARLASTRLPGKPLVDIAGTPMVVRVAQQAHKATVDSVVVAVDDASVQQVVQDAGLNAMLTAVDHASGSDRVMEVAERSGWDEHDVVINVQGDEPLIPPEVINQLASAMQDNAQMSMSTLSEPLASVTTFLDPNVVKVVTDLEGRALYFSRAPIPYPRDELANDALTEKELQTFNAQRHVGVYAFRVAALRRFITLDNSVLERTERLEQLRWLEAGEAIHVFESARPVPGGVDTPEDLARVRQAVI